MRRIFEVKPKLDFSLLVIEIEDEVVTIIRTIELIDLENDLVPGNPELVIIYVDDNKKRGICFILAEIFYEEKEGLQNLKDSFEVDCLSSCIPTNLLNQSNPNIHEISKELREPVIKRWGIEEKKLFDIIRMSAPVYSLS